MKHLLLEELLMNSVELGQAERTRHWRALFQGAPVLVGDLRWDKDHDTALRALCVRCGPGGQHLSPDMFAEVLAFAESAQAPELTETIRHRAFDPMHPDMDALHAFAERGDHVAGDLLRKLQYETVQGDERSQVHAVLQHDTSPFDSSQL